MLMTRLALVWAALSALSFVVAAPLEHVQVLPSTISSSNLDKRATPASQEDFNELQRAARLCSSVYVACQNKSFGVTITKQINNLLTSTQGFVGYDTEKKRISVVMRGSTFITDFINDLDITLGTPKLSGVTFPAGTLVMNGIIRPWASVHGEIMDEVRSLVARFPDFSLEATGHSLGGSLTYLSHVALAQNFPTKQVTSNALAAFPIGNDVFAKFAESQKGSLRRGNNQIDGVPNMYPFFKHYGTEFFGAGAVANTVKCNGQRDLACSAGLPLFTLAPGHFQSFGIILGFVGCG